MALRIFGRKNSINVQKVIWCASETATKFERIDVGGKFGFPADYLTLNPNKTVPSIIDTDGFSLWESHAICKYLAQRKGTSLDGHSLYPADDLKSRALIDQWSDWQATVVGPPVRTIFWALVRTPEDQINHKQLDQAKSDCNKYWGALNASLKKDGSGFIVGQKFSVADINIAISAHRWFTLVSEKEREPYEALFAWYQNMCTRPLFVEHVTSLKLD